MTRRKKKNQNSIIDDIVLVSIIIIGVILFLGNLGKGSIIGNTLSSVFFGVFGVVEYVIPFILILETALIMGGNEKNRFKYKVIVGNVFLWIIMGIIQILDGIIKTNTYIDYFISSQVSHRGGGFLGGLIGKTLVELFGGILSILILIGFSVICIILITGRAFVKEKGSACVKSVGLGARRTKESLEEFKKKREIDRKEKEERLSREVKIDEMMEESFINIKLGEDKKDEIKGEEEKNSFGINISNLKKSNNISNNEIPSNEEGELPLEKNNSNNTSLSNPLRKNKIGIDTSLIDNSTYKSRERELEKVISNPIRKDYNEESTFRTLNDKKEESTFINNDNPFLNIKKNEEESLKEDSPFITLNNKESSERPYSGNEENKILTFPTNKSFSDNNSNKVESFSSGIRFTSPNKDRDLQEEKKDRTFVSTGNFYNENSFREYKFPSLDLLRKGDAVETSSENSKIKENAIKLEDTIRSFGVGAKIVNITVGPSVTRYELQPEIGVKVKRISDLSDDLRLALAVADIRIEAPVPGKSVVGIEVPNKTKSGIMLRDLLEDREFKDAKSNITFAVGKDISGNTIIQDIKKLPHLLVGGATGSGKSVFINTLIMSILYKAKPEDVKLFLIDPKMIELNTYAGIPHLFTPVVTDPKKAAGVLNYAVGEMTRRYELFSKLGVRNLEGYNEKIKKIKEDEDGTPYEKKPQIVIVVDEFADLMMVAKGDVEEAVCRLAQLARAAGIHLILATQRPSVDVITGLIKANMPSRCALMVSSGVDSRTIIDQVGAEKLLGNGDMLYYPSGLMHPVRVQGAYVSEEEVEKVVNFIIEENGEMKENEEVESKISNTSSGSVSVGGSGEEVDEYFREAGLFLIEKEKASIGLLQRKFKIGFNRAARIMESLHEIGLVGEEEGTKPRSILMTEEEFFNVIGE